MRKELIFINNCFVSVFYIALIALCILNPWCLVFLVVFSFLPGDKKRAENKIYVYNSAGRRFKVITQ